MCATGNQSQNKTKQKQKHKKERKNGGGGGSVVKGAVALPEDQTLVPRNLAEQLTGVCNARFTGSHSLF